ncbi:L,D-transpeptidase [Lacticaseibacillus jixiensis]|uniref:L,D-transpeptidase n=1 Tax=Lacticaseibacillus jixiensis TaxID=3231926 RepID=UPI0036F2BC33
MRKLSITVGVIAVLLATGAISDSMTGSSSVHAATTAVAQSKTAKLADNRYVTVTHQYNTYADFKFTKLHAAADVYQRTYHSTARYHHANGSTYLALADANGKFMGYINQRAVSVAQGSQGVWLKANAYTTFSNANLAAYADFGLTQVKTSGAALSGQVVKISGMYRRFDGTLVYSLYNNRGQWLGYVNAAQIKLTGAQGAWHAASGYFATTKRGTSLWSGFDFSHSKSTYSNSYYRHTYQITGQYHHFSGATYYSLQDGSGRWVGYVNAALGTKVAGAQGQWYAYSGKYTVAKQGYPIWHGFFTNQVTTTTARFGKTYRVTGQYRHLNGSLYDSLYDGNTWVGYVNAAAMKPYAAYRDWLKPSQATAYPNLNKYRNINIEVNLAKQQVYIKNGSTNLYTMYCSSGAGNTTPRGHFKIQNRGASFYNPSEGMGARYWTSFKDWGVYLFHSVPTDRNGHYITAAAKLLGVRPDSHGCIRLSVPDAKWINSYIKQGTAVYIH